MLSRTLLIVIVATAGTACAQNPASVQELYQSAQAEAQAGQTESSLGLLEQAIDSGFRNYGALVNDVAFADLRENERFIGMLAEVRGRAYPCEASDKHRQFDFWVGTWDVHMANGAQAGVNEITVLENGCVLEELWRSSNGGTGRSLNYYDANKDKWVQHWVSADGLIIDIEGGLEDGAMVMTGRSYYTASGRSADFRGRWSLLEDGRVRQYFEESSDGGKTWNPWFEGFYQRRAE